MIRQTTAAGMVTNGCLAQRYVNPGYVFIICFFPSSLLFLSGCCELIPFKIYICRITQAENLHVLVYNPVCLLNQLRYDFVNVFVKLYNPYYYIPSN